MPSAQQATWHIPNPNPHGPPSIEVNYAQYVSYLHQQVSQSLSQGVSLSEYTGTITDEESPMPRKKKNEPPFLELPLKTAFDGFQKYKDKPGEIGLELECEGRSLFMAPVSFWRAVQDGSLRAVDGHQPVEYVLREPIPREKVSKALAYLAKRLKTSGSELKMSHRCSVHVHVNCLDLTLKQIAQFLCLYFIFEELLVEFSGAERAGNLFCLRAKDADFQIELLVQAFRSFNFGDVFNQNFRYSACNATALGTHGSLEFRSMRGSVDQQAIEEWVKLLLHFKDRAQMYPDPASVATEFMNMGPAAFADKFFTGSPVSPQTRAFFRNHHSLTQSLWTGFRTMRDVAFAIDWNNPPPLNGKVSRTIEQHGELDDDD